MLGQASVPVPLTIFRFEFDQNLHCSGLKYAQPITTTFCARHDSYSIVTCATCRCDRWSTSQTTALQILVECDRNIVTWTGAWSVSRPSPFVQLTYISTDVDVAGYIISSQWGLDKMAAIFQTTISNAFSWMEMYKFCLKFPWSLFLRCELQGDKPLSTSRMFNLLKVQDLHTTHISANEVHASVVTKWPPACSHRLLPRGHQTDNGRKLWMKDVFVLLIPLKYFRKLFGSFEWYFLDE